MLQENNTVWTHTAIVRAPHTLAHQHAPINQIVPTIAANQDTANILQVARVLLTQDFQK